ncbi:unnamed protein product, partial [Protopolystoma xenopodis]
MRSEPTKAINKEVGHVDALDKDSTPTIDIETRKDEDLLALESIQEQIRYIEKAISTKEPHYMMRVLRSISAIRKKLNYYVLRSLVQGYYPSPSPHKDYFTEFLPEAMETDFCSSKFRPRMGKSSSLLPEVEAYLHLLLLIFLIDEKHYEEATKCSSLLMDRLNGSNRRYLSMFAGRCYFYHSRAFELVGRLEDIRSFLHSRLRTATLRNHHDSQAVLINLLLRNYLHYNLYDQAFKLISRVVFPESAPNNEWARYLYYFGRIKAIQLDYSAAHEHLVSALRKAPQYTAVGFKQSLHKLNTVVELLLGEQPDRTNFRHNNYKMALQPYFQLTRSIHAGNLGQFNDVLRSYGPQFVADETYTLIIRLRHNVIKTGVRRISLSYSCIALPDVAAKLQLDSPEDAEYIVA